MKRFLLPFFLLLAVQFHPEKLLQNDDRMLPLFEYFIDRCAAR